MDPRILEFVRPLYLDLDGVSRFDEVERVSRLARALYRGSDPRQFELLLVFHGLKGWLEKVGNQSRTLLVLQGAISEEELRAVLRALGRLDAPESPEEIALASAQAIDRAGVSALVQQFVAARRQGTSPQEIAAAEIARGEAIPSWMPEEARAMLAARRARAREVCHALLEESRVAVNRS